ncbi:hypothetical protein [Cohnella boryungensis]|jgi:Na+/H+-dicarboxylate symporter|uniref:Uncharacterized protein n=1 Tax=Cohnella boryungensis TaxID=768479 RepID=A0ABV8SKI5_9BACL
MTASWRFKVGFGGFGAVLTLLFSLSNNPLGTTLLRSLYAFLAFTALAFVVSFLLSQLLRPGSAAANLDVAEPERGAVLDLTTPEEDEALTEMMKDQWADGKGEPVKGFQPLQPTRLVSLDNPNPEEVVQAIRRLTDE